jgi:hypothetical protein
MKYLNWIAWISAGIGTALLLLAAISVIVGRPFAGAGHIINYFQAANCFFLITIASFVYLIKCQCKKEGN